MRISKLESFELFIGLFLLLGFVPPAYLNQNLAINKILDLMRLISFILVFLFYMIDFEIHIKKPFNWILVLLYVELLLATIMSKNASIHSYIGMAIPSLGLIMFVEEFTIHNPYIGIKSLYIYFSICTLINTLTVFLFPAAMYANNRGMWVCWFLGEDNGGYVYYIVASICAMLYSYYITKKNTLLSILIWINSFLFVFYRDIATGKICQLLWILLFWGYQGGYLKKVLRARYAFDVSLIGFILLVLSRHSILETIAVFFNRRASLGRTNLWDCVLDRIMERPIWGFGICSGEEFNKIALNNGLLHAHNWILMIAFYGGVIAIVLFWSLFFCACYQAKEFRSARYYQYVSIGLLIYMVRFLVEAGDQHFLFMFLAMLAYSKEFLKNMNEEDCLEDPSLFEVTGIPKIKLSFRRSMK